MSEQPTHAEVGQWINDAVYKTDKSQRSDYSYSDRLGGEFLAKIEREGWELRPIAGVSTNAGGFRINVDPDMPPGQIDVIENGKRRTAITGIGDDE